MWASSPTSFRMTILRPFGFAQGDKTPVIFQTNGRNTMDVTREQSPCVTGMLGTLTTMSVANPNPIPTGAY